MIPGRKEQLVLWRGGILDLRKEREGERETERKQYMTLHKRNTSPKSVTGKWEGLIIASFYKQQSPNFEVLEFHTTSGWTLVGIAVLLWERRTEAWEQTAQSKNPLGHTRKDNSPSWSKFCRGGWSLRGEKRWWEPTCYPIGTETPVEVSKPWCWLFATLCHKLQAAV